MSALRTEWFLNRSTVLGTAGIAVLAVFVLAVFVHAVSDLKLAALVPVIAGLAPALLADRDPERTRDLSAALGDSRADAIRARTVMVCGMQWSCCCSLPFAR